MDAVAGQISRALGSENDEEPDVNAPLCANDLSGPNKPQKLKSFASFGLAEFPDTPSKGLSVCLSLCFILIAVIVFTATIKATIDPARAKVSNTQINAIESDVKHQIRSSMKSTVKMQKKAVQQRKTDNREVKNLERQVQRLERTVRQIEAPRTEVVPERREVVIARPERESTILPLRGGGVMEERGGPEAVLVRGGERGERGVSWREEGAKHDSAARLHQRHRREQDRAGPGRARGSVGGQRSSPPSSSSSSSAGAASATVKRREQEVAYITSPFSTLGGSGPKNPIKQAHAHSSPGRGREGGRGKGESFGAWMRHADPVVKTLHEARRAVHPTDDQQHVTTASRGRSFARWLDSEHPVVRSKPREEQERARERERERSDTRHERREEEATEKRRSAERAEEKKEEGGGEGGKKEEGDTWERDSGLNTQQRWALSELKHLGLWRSSKHAPKGGWSDTQESGGKPNIAVLDNAPPHNAPPHNAPSHNAPSHNAPSDSGASDAVQKAAASTGSSRGGGRGGQGQSRGCSM